MKRSLFAVSLVWIALVGASFFWNYLNARDEQGRIAFQTAKSFFDQIVLSRTWNSLHGGVYVPVADGTQPNAYLEDPLRDIVVNEHLTLTKVNPAFMTRQLSEIAEKQQGIQFHITSLNPIRPENRATPLEEEALRSFERGIRQVGRIVRQGSDSTYFFMAPIRTEKACLKCHAKQGYREGDIRGGISVTLPFIPRIPLGALLVGHLMIGLAGWIGILVLGMKLDRANESLRRQAVLDALTGIPNRRSFSEYLLREFNRSRREKLPLAVLMGDVDRFKLYNDTYGHSAGDECLKKIAQTIRHALKRPGDFCARYGGEEFVIILPNTPREGARFIAESIRQAVLDLEMPHEKSLPGKRVSMSLGVAAWSDNDPISHEQLLKRADEALYAAKEKGRNRVEGFSPDEPPAPAGREAIIP
jgi:diguanylate cyclase (GGDEF)-like protein